MTHVRRLGVAGVLLTLAALISTTHVWGEPDKGKKVVVGEKPGVPKIDSEDEPSASRFADHNVLRYDTATKEPLIGWQVQPTLNPVPARPRDLLILLDNSASQARGPLQNARLLAEELLKNLGDEDTAAVWMANVEPKKLTKKFEGKGKHEDVFKALKQEYPSGASNLKKVIAEGIKSFGDDDGRQRAIILMGDGMSVAGPIDGDVLSQLTNEMVKKEIAFYSVPLGVRLDPITLHGMATCTGGAVVRMKRGKGAEQFVKDLNTAMSVPVLYPETVKFTDNVAEIFPLKLPPLRADAATLLVGKLAKVAPVGCTIVGKVSGREVRVDVSEAVPGDEIDNFFLATMIQQWREQKDRPALLKADRALAFIYEQNQLARAELLAQAEWALEKNEIDAASRLYDQTLELDPNSVDARAGKVIARQIKDGKLTREQLRKLIEPKGDDKIVRIDGKVRAAKVNREKLLALAQVKADDEKKDNPPPVLGEDRINQFKQRQVVEDQRNRELVRDAVFEAKRLLTVNPDAANDLLKRTLAGIQENPDISARAKISLADDLRNEIRTVIVLGDQNRRRVADRQQALAIAQERLGLAQEQKESDDRTRELMRNINQLMNKARIEVITGGEYYNRTVAIKAAEDLRRRLISDGKPIPPALNAAYGIAQADFHLTELNELRRLREQRYLLSFLEVERRHLPFPDEPPIEFPPAAKWKALTQNRKGKYESFRFLGQSSNKNLKRILDVMNTVEKEFAEIAADPQTKFGNLLNAISTKYSRAGENPPFYLTFEINVPAFEAEGVKEVSELAIVGEKALPRLVNVTLSTYLRRILDRTTEKGPVPSGATFVIRKEADLPIIVNSYDERDLPPAPHYVVEITTGIFAARHKETVAYSVADLVTPIPQAANKGAVQQSATLFGQFGMQGGVAGQFGAGQQQFGGAGLALGGAGLALGGAGLALGGAGLALGGAGLALGGAGLALGGAGLALGGGGVLAGGAAGVQGMNNFGVGGGQAGFQGGQMGQLGNIGGQFGFQGGTQEGILIQTIRQLVGEPGDWAGIVPGLAGPGMLPGGPGDPTAPADPIAGTLNNNQLGYFPSALALVVKGTSLIHSRTTRASVSGMGGPPAGGAAANMGAAPGIQRGDVIVIGGPRDPNRRVLGAGGKEEPVVKDPKKKPFKSDLDPRVAWQEALEKGTDLGPLDPGMIVATVDFLMMLNKYDQAAEFLKANLRQGVVVRPWVFETLAICLKESNASEEEIERAEVALADLEPQDAEGFLKASHAMASMKRWDRALAFCRQASILEPNAPQSYADALNYAESARDVDAMEWAASSLLKQDWPRKSGDMHQKAVQKLNAMSKQLGDDRVKDAERLKNAIVTHQQRDLIIKLRWAGTADLDLKVEEPTGSICSTLQKQSPGGGTLIGDTLSDKNSEMYIAAQAFRGKYKITVDRIWGEPSDNKAQIQVIRHQGTDKESSQVFTLNLKDESSMVLDLTEGRRTQAAAVPPSSLQQTSEDLEPGASHQDLMSRLTSLADPEITGSARGRVRGAVGSPFATPAEEQPMDFKAEAAREGRKGERLTQNRVAPVINTDVSFTTQTIVSPDRTQVRVTLNPVFNNFVSKMNVRPAISIIPGGPKP